MQAAGGKVETTSDAVTLKLKPTLDGMVKQAKNYGLMSDPDINPDIRSLQHMLLFGIKGMAAYTDHAAEHECRNERQKKQTRSSSHGFEPPDSRKDDSDSDR